VRSATFSLNKVARIATGVEAFAAFPYVIGVSPSFALSQLRGERRNRDENILISIAPTLSIEKFEEE
jgi:hypothetical protein